MARELVAALRTGTLDAETRAEDLALLESLAWAAETRYFRRLQ